MAEIEKIPAGRLKKLGSPEREAAEKLLAKNLQGFEKKIIVLDDDPTGVQTVHDVSVYTDWEESTIRQGFLEETSMFFILTNSRSFSEEETVRAHQEIARRICKVSREQGREFFLISRGDSTLRGHYPLEMEVLRRELEREGKLCVDGEILCPFFPEGGRFTFGNVHYVKEKNMLVPAGMTEFAKDKTFGYQSSDLREYVEEKTKGQFPADSCITISLEELRAYDTEGIRRKLLGASDMAKVIVNAVTYEDLKVFCAVLAQTVKEGKYFLARTAAAFPKVMGQISDKPLLSKAELARSEKNGGVVLVGSHVKKTTDQLNYLKKSHMHLEFMEFDVNTSLEEGGLITEVEKTVKKAEDCILAGRTAVIYTSRTLLAPESMDKESLLKISVEISEAVTSIIGKLTVRPGFIIAKGGITSSDVGTKALRVRKAAVMGQIKAGIPVWMTGSESKFPGMPYIIFPGNVGEVSTLREIVEELG